MGSYKKCSTFQQKVHQVVDRIVVLAVEIYIVHLSIYPTRMDLIKTLDST